MPQIDLTRDSIPSNDPILDDLQCNILSPHRRNRSVHLFVRLPGDQEAALRYVAGWTAKVTSMSAQGATENNYRAEKIVLLAQFAAGAAKAPRLSRGGLVKSFMLSASGLETLGMKPADFPSLDEFFSEGMRRKERELFPASRIPANGPTAGWSNEWLQKFPDGTDAPIHAHIIIAADGPRTPGRSQASESAALRTDVQVEVAALNQAGGAVMHRLEGYTCKNQAGQAIEHFGYADGISNPLFLEGDLIWARTNRPSPLVLNPAELQNALFAFSHGGVDYAGSLCVFRQIEQNVGTFSTLQRAAANELVGRAPDGTPIADSTLRGVDINNFVYPDPKRGPGSCPFHAHVRKANPRGGSEKQPLREPATLFPRRGMLYGDRAFDDQTMTFTDKPRAGAGLLFMGYMGAIKSQFRKMQRDWFAGADFPQTGSGLDQLVGLGASTHTTVLGGEYFFVPPKSWLAAQAP
jgi:Dyp-type peroxidase family